ncbi:MAG: homoserine kinase [Actinomycetota bacterium]
MNGVCVTVPATIANLGPGFDCLALAVEWRNKVTVSFAGSTSISVSGMGADRIPRDDSNLVLRALRACETGVAGEHRNYEIKIENESPYGRGFGSSAAAIVGGVVAARELLGSGHKALEVAGKIEGHLDNVSAALLGGVTISGFSPTDALRLDPPPELAVLACVAAERLSTSVSRKALPPNVPFKDATSNVSRSSLLVASIASGNLDFLLEATEDKLHQPSRFQIAPDSATLVNVLRSHGYAAFLSGAGPSVAALIHADHADAAESLALQHAPPGWQVVILKPSQDGARVI